MRADFLVLHYRSLDILFARDLFYASTYRKASTGRADAAGQTDAADKADEADEAGADPGGSVMFGELVIRDFDLDSYVRSLFPGLVGEKPLLGAVCRKAAVLGEAPDAVPAGDPAGEDLISLAIPSDSDVRSYALSEFRPLPYNLHSSLERKGMRAIRFEGAKAQFFCDARVFIPACMAADGQGGCR